MNFMVCKMRFLKRLISFIAVVAFIIIIYNVFKPEIKAFFISRGINVPGVTQDIGVFPTSKTVTDSNGNDNDNVLENRLKNERWKPF